jgi:hypothetical protein
MRVQPRLLLLIFSALVFVSVQGRTEDAAAVLKTRIPECAVQVKDGPWVPKELYADGVLRFTYLYEPPKQNPGEYDYRDQSHNVYAAFWNRDRTRGELLQFLWVRRTAPIHLRIINNGHIVTQQGKTDIEDTLWGVWTHEHLMRRLAQLRTAAVQTVAVREIPHSGATCDSYAHVANDTASASPPKR